MEISVILFPLVIGVFLAWIMRRFGFSETMGLVFSGFIAVFLMRFFSVDVKQSIAYSEPLRLLGLILFAFEIGASIGIRELSKAIHRVVAAELVSYIVIWVISGLTAYALGLSFIDRIIIFLIIVNSSTIAIVAISKVNISNIRSLAITQTSLEDLMQFALFTVLMVAGFSSFQSVQIVSWLLRIGGLTIFFLLISKYSLRFLARSPFIRDKEGRFFLSIIVALLFATIASIIGLPPLFGAFIAGICFSAFQDLTDISEMLRGLRDVGILLYFTSLGSQLCLDVFNMLNIADVFIKGLIIGFIATLTRILGITLGVGLSGSGISKSSMLALLLCPLSEIGIVFVDALALEGIIPSSTVAIVTFSVLTSLTFFGFIIPKGIMYTYRLESVLPRFIIDVFDVISTEYLKRIDTMISTISVIIRFVVVMLVLSYISTVSEYLAKELVIPPIISIAISIICSLATLIVFILTLRSLYRSIISSISTPSQRISENFGKALDLVIGGLTIILQVYILYDFMKIFELIEPLYHTVLIASNIAIIIVTVYEIIRYLRRKL
ncbi:MAG: cation:proton antiporter [Candidatus Methanomethylicia archaeon]